MKIESVIYICIYTYIHTHICLHTHTSIHAYMSTYTYIYTRICVVVISAMLLKINFICTALRHQEES